MYKVTNYGYEVFGEYYYILIEDCELVDFISDYIVFEIEDLDFIRDKFYKYIGDELVDADSIKPFIEQNIETFIEKISSENGLYIDNDMHLTKYCKG